MKLCSPNSFFNFTLTWIIFKTEPESQLYYRDQDGNMAGKMADHILRGLFLDEPEFVWTTKIGEYDPTTGRYDGAIGYLMDGKADVFIRPMEFGTINGDLVDYLKVPFLSASFSPFQLIERLEESSGHLSSGQTFDFLAPSLSFLIIVTVGLLLHRISLALFSVKFLSILRFKSAGGSSERQRGLRVKILTLFKLLFLFFNRKLFEGNLNTANVVVQTDDLLYSEEQVLNTQKEFCFIDTNSRLNFLKSVPKQSLIDKIFAKANGTEPCFFVTNNRVGNVLRRDLNEIFTLIPHISLDFVTRTAQTFLQRHTYAETSLEVFQSVRTFIIRKGLKRAESSFFERYLAGLVEHGVVKKFYANFPNFFGIELAKRGGKDGFEHYASLQDYIADHTIVIPLPFYKLDYLFRIYGGLLIVLLLAFLVHYLSAVRPIYRTLLWFRSIKIASFAE